MNDPISPDILQAIRTAHCARVNKDHACVGTCTITPAGITLACKVCGDADETVVQSHTSAAAMRVRGVLEAVGLDYDKLAPEAQRDAIDVMAQDPCPGCRRLRVLSKRHGPDFYHCPCGGWVHSGLSWRGKKDG